MSEPNPAIDPAPRAALRHRAGFVAFLSWTAAVTGGIGMAQGLSAGWGRWLLISVTALLATLFSYVWWELGRQRSGQ